MDFLGGRWYLKLELFFSSMEGPWSSNLISLPRNGKLVRLRCFWGDVHMSHWKMHVWHSLTSVPSSFKEYGKVIALEKVIIPWCIKKKTKNLNIRTFYDKFQFFLLRFCKKTQCNHDATARIQRMETETFLLTNAPCCYCYPVSSSWSLC